jgi:hypothetical protein
MARISTPEPVSDFEQAQVYERMEQRFPAAYDSSTITAIVEYRQPAAQRAVAGVLSINYLSNFPASQ